MKHYRKYGAKAAQAKQFFVHIYTQDHTVDTRSELADFPGAMDQLNTLHAELITRKGYELVSYSSVNQRIVSAVLKKADRVVFTEILKASFEKLDRER